jgi:hypothetical protein
MAIEQGGTLDTVASSSPLNSEATLKLQADQKAVLPAENARKQHAAAKHLPHLKIDGASHAGQPRHNLDPAQSHRPRYHYATNVEQTYRRLEQRRSVWDIAKENLHLDHVEDRQLTKEQRALVAAYTDEIRSINSLGPGDSHYVFVEKGASVQLPGHTDSGGLVWIDKKGLKHELRADGSEKISENSQDPKWGYHVMRDGSIAGAWGGIPDQFKPKTNTSEVATTVDKNGMTHQLWKKDGHSKITNQDESYGVERYADGRINAWGPNQKDNYKVSARENGRQSVTYSDGTTREFWFGHGNDVSQFKDRDGTYWKKGADGIWGHCRQNQSGELDFIGDNEVKDGSNRRTGTVLVDKNGNMIWQTEGSRSTEGPSGDKQTNRGTTEIRESVDGARDERRDGKPLSYRDPVDEQTSAERAKAIHDSFHFGSLYPTDKKALDELLKNTNEAQRKVIGIKYQELFGCPIEQDLGRALKGADLDRSLNLWHKQDFNESNQSAKHIHSLLLAMSESSGDAASEAQLRCELSTKTATQLAAIDTEFKNAYNGTSLKDAILNAGRTMSSGTFEAAKIYLDRNEQNADESVQKLADNALRCHDDNLLREAFAGSSSVARKQFFDNGGEQKIRDTFKGSWQNIFANFIPTAIHGHVTDSDLQKDMDAAKYGKVSPGQEIRDNIHPLGNNRQAIEAVLAGFSPKNRELYRLGKQGTDNKEAVDFYNNIHAALTETARDGSAELASYEDQIAFKGGSLVKQLAKHEGLIYNDGRGAAFGDIEKLNETDWQAIKQDMKDHPGQYRKEVETTLGSLYGPGEASRILETFDRKLAAENFDLSKENGQRSIFDAFEDNTGLFRNDRRAIIDSLQRMNANEIASYRSDANFKQRLDALVHTKLSGTALKAAEHLLKQIDRGEKPTEDLIVQLYLHKDAAVTDLRAALQDIERTFKADPNARIKYGQDPDFKDATSFLNGDYRTYLDQLLEKSELDLVTQQDLASSRQTNVKTGETHVNINHEQLFNAIVTASASERQRLLSDEAYRQQFMQHLLPGEKDIALKVLGQDGELRAEDKLHLAIVQEDSNQLMEILKDVQAQKEHSPQQAGPDPLEQIKTAYAAKYQSDLNKDALAIASSKGQLELAIIFAKSTSANDAFREQERLASKEENTIGGQLCSLTSGTNAQLENSIQQCAATLLEAHRQGKEPSAQEMKQMQERITTDLLNLRDAKDTAAEYTINAITTGAAIAGGVVSGGTITAAYLAEIAAASAVIRVAGNKLLKGDEYQPTMQELAKELATGMVDGLVSAVGPGEIAALARIGVKAGTEAVELTAKQLAEQAVKEGVKRLLTTNGEAALRDGAIEIMRNATVHGIKELDQKALLGLAEKAVDASLTGAERSRVVQMVYGALNHNLKDAVQSESKKYLQQFLKQTLLNTSAGMSAGATASAARATMEGKSPAVIAEATLGGMVSGGAGALAFFGAGKLIGAGIHVLKGKTAEAPGQSLAVRPSQKQIDIHVNEHNEVTEVSFANGMKIARNENGKWVHARTGQELEGLKTVSLTESGVLSFEGPNGKLNITSDGKVSVAHAAQGRAEHPGQPTSSNSDGSPPYNASHTTASHIAASHEEAFEATDQSSSVTGGTNTSKTKIAPDDHETGHPLPEQKSAHPSLESSAERSVHGADSHEPNSQGDSQPPPDHESAPGRVAKTETNSTPTFEDAREPEMHKDTTASRPRWAEDDAPNQQVVFKGDLEPEMHKDATLKRLSDELLPSIHAWDKDLRTQQLMYVTANSLDYIYGLKQVLSNSIEDALQLPEHDLKELLSHLTDRATADRVMQEAPQLRKEYENFLAHVKKARPEVEEIASIRTQRQSETQSMLNRLMADHNLPRIELKIEPDYEMPSSNVASFDMPTGRLILRESALFGVDSPAEVLATIAHELTHNEQAYLHIRKFADDLGIGIQPTATQFQQLREELARFYGEENSTLEREQLEGKNHIDQYVNDALALRAGKHLSVSDSQRAADLESSQQQWHTETEAKLRHAENALNRVLSQNRVLEKDPSTLLQLLKIGMITGSKTESRILFGVDQPPDDIRELLQSLGSPNYSRGHALSVMRPYLNKRIVELKTETEAAITEYRDLRHEKEAFAVEAKLKRSLSAREFTSQSDKQRNLLNEIMRGDEDTAHQSAGQTTTSTQSPANTESPGEGHAATDSLAKTPAQTDSSAMKGDSIEAQDLIYKSAPFKFKSTEGEEVYSADGFTWRIRRTSPEGFVTDNHLINGSAEQLPNGAMKYTELNGTSYVCNQNGSVEKIDANGHYETTKADLVHERSGLQQSISQLHQGTRSERFNGLLAEYEQNVGSGKEKEIAIVYHHINRLLAADDGLPLPRAIRFDLAEQVLNHLAHKETIDQGYNPTCGVAAVEHRCYVREPDVVAQIVADIATTGRYITHKGIVVDLTKVPGGILPDVEARGNMTLQNASAAIKYDGSRDFASQIMETALVNCKVAQRTFVVDANGNYLEYPTVGTASSTDSQQVVYNGDGSQTRLYDAEGKPLEHFRPGDAAYDSDGKISLHYLKGGQVAYGRQTVDDQTDMGNRLFDISGDSPVALKVQGKPVTDTTVNASDLARLEYDLTGRSTKPYYITAAIEDVTQNDSFIIPARSTEQLARVFQMMTDRDNLPCIIRVNAAYPPFTDMFGSIRAAGTKDYWHAINLQGYDPATKMVQITNQWGSKWDYIGQKGVPLETIFRSMQPSWGGRRLRQVQSAFRTRSSDDARINQPNEINFPQTSGRSTEEHQGELQERPRGDGPDTTKTSAPAQENSKTPDSSPDRPLMLRIAGQDVPIAPGTALIVDSNGNYAMGSRTDKMSGRSIALISRRYDGSLYVQSASPTGMTGIQHEGSTSIDILTGNPGLGFGEPRVIVPGEGIWFDPNSGSLVTVEESAPLKIGSLVAYGKEQHEFRLVDFDKSSGSPILERADHALETRAPIKFTVESAPSNAWKTTFQGKECYRDSLGTLYTFDETEHAFVENPKYRIATDRATQITGPRASDFYLEVGNLYDKQKINLSQREINLGRGNDMDVHFAESTVSNFHATLKLGPDGVMRIKDVGTTGNGSTGGTFVNGRRIHGWTVVKPGSEISLGGQAKFKLGLEPTNTSDKGSSPTSTFRAAQSEGPLGSINTSDKGGLPTSISSAMRSDDTGNFTPAAIASTRVEILGPKRFVLQFDPENSLAAVKFPDGTVAERQQDHVDKWRLTAADGTAQILSRVSYQLSKGELVLTDSNALITETIARDGTTTVCNNSQGSHFVRRSDGLVIKAEDSKHLKYFYDYKDGELVGVRKSDGTALERKSDHSWENYDQRTGVRNMMGTFYDYSVDNQGCLIGSSGPYDTMRVELDGTTNYYTFGRLDSVKGNEVGIQRNALKSLISAKLAQDPETVQKLFSSMDHLEGRSSESGAVTSGIGPIFIDPNEVAQTYKEVGELISAQTAFLKSNRIALAQEILFYAAHPSLISQGSNPTCVGAVIENRLMSLHPSEVARLIKEVALTGTYTDARGNVIDMTHFHIDEQAQIAGFFEPGVTDPLRGLSNQIFQETALNACWQESSVDPNGTPVEKGDIFYGKVLPSKTTFEGYDTGYRLINRRTGQHYIQPFASPNNPLTRSADIITIHNLVTNFENFGSNFLFEKGMRVRGKNGFVSLDSVSNLKEALAVAAEKGEMPVIVGVDGKHPILKGTSNGSGHQLNHVLTLRSYSPETGEVEVVNQHGRDKDFVIGNTMKVEDLAKAMLLDDPASRTSSTARR